jgi:adenylate cyclase 10
MRADALLIKNNILFTEFEKISDQLITFIPAALIPFILIEQEQWSAELRKITLLFVKIKINFTLSEI